MPRRGGSAARDSPSPSAHLEGDVLWGKARDVSDHGGIVVVRARDCRIHGARKRGGGGGFAAAPQSPRAPGAASVARARPRAAGPDASRAARSAAAASAAGTTT